MNGNGGLARRTEAGSTARQKKPANPTPATAPKHHREHPSYKSRRWAQ